MAKSKSGTRVGKFFLKVRKGVYQICWYEGGQTRSISARTTDIGEAELALAAHALSHSEPEARKDAPLADALSYYWIERGQHLPSEDTFRSAMREALEILDNPMCSELTAARQKFLIKALRARGLSDGTIARRLSCIWAALKLYQGEGYLASYPARIGTQSWGATFGKRTRVLSLGELAKLLEASADSEHRWRFMVLAIGTASRPKAILELTGSQIDREAGILHLNPEGRAQTKKRRPAIPMAPTLSGWVSEWSPEGHTGPVIEYRDKAMTSDTFFDNLVKEAGVECCRYDIRHTVITWLVKKKVPPDEREIFVGHRLPGSATTEHYVHLDPDYLSGAAKAIEELFQALAPLVKNLDLLRTGELEEQPVPESVASEVDSILAKLRSHA